MDTGTYLRPHDMLFCIERTKFTEEQIVAWFKRKVNNYTINISIPHLFTVYDSIDVLSYCQAQVQGQLLINSWKCLLNKKMNLR